jgi:hypothetical protein
MHNHISDLPFNIKQATDGLNKLISMLYDIAAPSSPLSSDIGDIRKASDHVRVMAMSLIKDCTKEKIEILTSQAAVRRRMTIICYVMLTAFDEYDYDEPRPYISMLLSF